MRIAIWKRPKSTKGWDMELTLAMEHQVENDLHAQVLTESLRKRMPDSDGVVVGYTVVAKSEGRAS